MRIQVNRIRNCTHRDLVILWDDKDGCLYIFPGPGWLGYEASDMFESGERKDYLKED